VLFDSSRARLDYGLTLGTVFVVASVGMAAGAGFTLPPCSLQSNSDRTGAPGAIRKAPVTAIAAANTFEVTGKNTDAVLNELSKIARRRRARDMGRNTMLSLA